jgi:hypothetical protein
MARLFAVEIEPEVNSWLAGLSDRDFGRVDFLVGLLAERAEDLGEPYTRHLGGKVRERKSRGSETAEVARSQQVQKICEAEHGPAHQAFDREVN